MKYTQSEVLDILKSVSDNPEEVLTNWVDVKANKPIDVFKTSYTNFVYSFPIIVKDEEVGEITLVDLYNNSHERDNLMLKYFGREDFSKTWVEFSHSTYLYCYLTIKKGFKLPKIVKGMRGKTFNSVDAKGKPFEFKVSYGLPEDEDTEYIYEEWVEGGYRFDNGVQVKFDEIVNGWRLDEKINERIKIRVRDEKINDVLN